MKIAFIVGAFPVLSETFILGQAIELVRRGHRVEIFAAGRPPRNARRTALAPRSLIRRTHYFGIWGDRGNTILALRAVVENLARNPAGILRALREFRRGAISPEQLNLLVHFLARSFDVIHCHFGPNGKLGCFLKGRGIPAPVVTSFYGYDVSLSLATGGREFYREMLREGDLFLPISDGFKSRLLALGCEPHKIVVYHSGIDLRAFPFVPRRLDPGKPVAVLTVGRLVEKKGHDYALRAVAKFAAVGRDIRYVIAGDGPLSGALRACAARLGIEGRVRFTGAVDHDEVRGLLSGAHLFLLPSVTARNGDEEGIPISIMEAQASGLPVLSTRHSGIPELVAD